MFPAFLFLFLPGWTVPPDADRLPDFYRDVAEVHWVVKDIDKAAEGWGKSGFPPDGEIVARDFKVSLRGRPVSGRERIVRGHIGTVNLVWIQPLRGRDAHSEFLQSHGSGICSLMHRVPSIESLESEAARLRSLGVPELQRGTIETDLGRETYVYFDTAKEGKYVLGLIHSPAAPASAVSAEMRTAQYALVVRDMRPVSAFWERLGFPALSYTHPTLAHLRYHGRPGTFDQELGWQRHGRIEYEWIVPLKGPTVYQDFLDAHGEGLHHLAFEVPDLDRAIANWAARASPCVQSGSWGEDGKPGWGRYAYIDTDPGAGVMIELLWNFRK